MSPFALAAIGLALGVRHAADSDHVIAVTAIAARQQRVLPAMRVGVLWGIGHSLTILAVGSLIILLNLALPLRVALGLEFAVGIALTVVGMLNLAGRRAPQPPSDGASGWRAFVVGLVHGLAGSAAVALMVLAAVREPLAACAYLVVFALGTVIGMVLVTAAFASPIALLARRFHWSGVGLRLATGALSVGFGAYVMYQVGVVGGLFAAAIPR